jgi:hypothetical protein
MISSITLVIASILQLCFQYFVVFPREQSDSFQYPLVQAIAYVKKSESRFSKVIFSNDNNLLQSYMHFLFHSKYDPIKYFYVGGTDSGGFAAWHKIGKYEFRPVGNEIHSGAARNLFIVNYEEKDKLELQNGKVVKIISNLKEEKKIAIIEL